MLKKGILEAREMHVLRSFKLFFQLSTYREMYNLAWLAVRTQLREAGGEPLLAHVKKSRANSCGGK